MARTVTNTLPRQQVDRLFRIVADGPPKEQHKAIVQLYALWSSTNLEERVAIQEYHFRDGSKTEGYGDDIQHDRDHYKVLLHAIPNLIEALKADQPVCKNSFLILISVQGFCPASYEYDLWMRWWNEKGREEFIEKAGLKQGR